MGIRYYAWPVPSDGVEAARLYPRAFMGRCRCLHKGCTAIAESCYLDKAWSELQWLLGSNSHDAGTPRPAAALVAGRVTMTDEGWIPHIKLLTPAEVAEASRDLRGAMPGLVATLTRERTHGDDEDDDYALSYLRVLHRFAAAQERAGNGMLYFIG
jgi:hypothetical protein